MRRLMMFNSPRAFQVAWSVIRGWLDPDVEAKISFVGDYAALQDEMDATLIMQRYGGQRTEEWPVQGADELDIAASTSSSKRVEMNVDRGALRRAGNDASTYSSERAITGVGRVVVGVGVLLSFRRKGAVTTCSSPSADRSARDSSPPAPSCPASQRASREYRSRADTARAAALIADVAPPERRALARSARSRQQQPSS
jgi:hypothetical protein